MNFVIPLSLQVIFSVLTLIFLIKAIFNKNDREVYNLVSTLASAFITLIGYFMTDIPKPVIYPLDGAIDSNLGVEIEIVADDWFTTYYSVNGEEPQTEYNGKFTINDEVTVAARNKFGFWRSEIEKQEFYFKNSNNSNDTNSVLESNNKTTVLQEPKKNLRSISIISSNISNIIEDLKEEKIIKVIDRYYKKLDKLATISVKIRMFPKVKPDYCKYYKEILKQQIKDMAAGEQIIGYNIVDLYGSTSKSIIISTKKKYGSLKRLLILDPENDERLEDINDLLLLKNNLNTSFSLIIKNNGKILFPNIEYVINIIDDPKKEIIVKYYLSGHVYDSYGTAILKFSESDSTYKIVGTYPKCVKINLGMYNGSSKRIEIIPRILDAQFKSDYSEENLVMRCYDGKDYFNLTEGWNGKWGNRCEYWIKTNDNGYLLAIVNTNYYGDNPTYINIYKPIFDNERNELKWELKYSEYANDLPLQYSDDDLHSVLVNILKSHVFFVEKYSDFCTYE